MDFFETILAERPVACLRLNSSLAISNIGTQAAAVAGSLIAHLPIARGSRGSFIANATTPLNFPSAVFVPGTENRPFAISMRLLEATRVTATNVALASHQSAYDGLALIGDELRFTIEFQTKGSVSAVYRLPVNYRAMTVVANYLVNKIQLIVNGEMVSEAEISVAQMSDGFKTRASSNIFTGHNTTSNYARSVIVDGISLFYKSLSMEAARRIHLANQLPYNPLLHQWSSMTLDWNNRVTFGAYTFPSEVGWESGYMDDVVLDGNILRPSRNYDTNTSITGSWTYAYVVQSSESNLYGIQVDWEGHGNFQVQYSTNDFSSHTVLSTPGQIVPGTFNVPTATLTPSIRIVFTGGVVDDDSYVSRLTIKSYVNEIVESTNYSRTAVIQDINSRTPILPADYLDFSDHLGVKTSGGILISSETEPDRPVPVRTIETVVRFDGTVSNIGIIDFRPGGGTAYITTSGTSVSFPSGTLFINGAQVTSGSYTLVTGRYYHFLYSLAADSYTSITLPASSDKKYLFINTYSTTTSPDRAKMYYQYLSDSIEPVSAGAESISLSDQTPRVNSNTWGTTFTP